SSRPRRGARPTPHHWVARPRWTSAVATAGCAVELFSEGLNAHTEIADFDEPVAAPAVVDHAPRLYAAPRGSRMSTASGGYQLTYDHRRQRRQNHGRTFPRHCDYVRGAVRNPPTSESTCWSRSARRSPCRT